MLMARPKRGDAQRQKALYLLDNFGVLPQRAIPPKCTTAKGFGGTGSAWSLARQPASLSSENS
jgi:hypothetical protein